MAVVAIFLNLANHSHSVSSGLALVLDSKVSFEEVEIVIKKVSGNAQAQVGATVESILDAIKAAVEGKALVTELKVITVQTEIFA